MASWAESAGELERSMRKPDGFASSDEIGAYLRSAARPFVLISERELSVLRRGLTKQGWKRALYLQPATEGEHTGASAIIGAGLLAQANYWLERPTDIPGRGGHYHNFFCEDGTRLEIPEDYKISREGYACPACGRVYAGEKFDGAVRWFQNQDLAQAAVSLALVYAIEKDRAYAEKAAEILKGYAGAYPGGHTTTTEGGQMYQSLDESLWIIRLAQAYDLIYHSNALHEEDRRLIEQKLFKPAAEGLISVGVHGNWGSWHLSAVGVVGLAIKDGSLVSYALEHFTRQMSEELGEDGLWPESVHCYHFFPLTAFIYLAEACYRSGIDLYNWEAAPGKGLKAMFTTPVSYAYPSFQLPAINDGWYYAFLPLNLYEIAFRRWGSPLFAWVLKTGYRFGERPVNSAQEEHQNGFLRNSFYAFLFGRDLPGRVPAPALASTDFPSIGICTLRSGGTMLTFDYGRFLGHGQLDKMGITIYSADNVIVPDFGTPGYGSEILNYYVNTPSHNTVIVDEKSQVATSEHRLYEFWTGELLQMAESQTSEAYPGVTHQRRVIMAGGAYLITDKLSSDEAHTFDWIIHAEGKLETSDSSCRPIDLSYQCSRDAAVVASSGAFNCSWSSESAGMGLMMWMDGPGEVIKCAFPAETGTRTVDSLIARRNGKSAEFLTLLCPYGVENRPECTHENGLIRITSGRSTQWIYLAGMATDGEAASAKLKSDASAAVVETVDGIPVRCALLGGHEIIWDREVLVECSDKLDHFEAQLQARSPVISCSGGDSGYLRLRSSCRAMRLNGHRVSASNSDGLAVLRLLPRSEPAPARLVR